jgi:nucleolar protein 12
VQPLPGSIPQPERRRKTRKGKERPLRPTKSEKEAARLAAAEAAEATDGNQDGGVASKAEAALTEDKKGAKRAKKEGMPAAAPVPVVGAPVIIMEKDNGAVTASNVSAAAAAAVAAAPASAKKEKKKGKKKEKDVGGKTEDAQQQEMEEEVGQDDAKDRRTIFVGNLPTSINKKRVQSLFKEYGEIGKYIGHSKIFFLLLHSINCDISHNPSSHPPYTESVRFRSMALTGAKIDDHGNQKLVKKVSANKRLLSDAKDTYNAYVVFVKEEAAVAALAVNKRLVEEKHLRVDRVGNAASRDPKRSVFLGNLPFDAKEDAVRAHVAKGLEGGEGDVEGVRLVRDPETQQGKGFGFVLLKDRASVAAALRLNESTFSGRKIRVTICGKRNKQRDDDGKPRVKPKHNAKRRLDAAGPRKKTSHSSSSPAKSSLGDKAKPSFEGRRASADAGVVNLKKRGRSAPKKSGGGVKKGRKGAGAGGKKKGKK